MKQLFGSVIDEIAHPNLGPGDVRLATLGLLRIMVQHAIIGIAEWLATRPQPIKTARDLNVFKVASSTNGSFIDLLADFLMTAEDEGWRISGVLFNPLEITDALVRRIDIRDRHLDGVLRAHASFRNEGAEGHGLPGNFDRDSDIELLQLVLGALEPTLPEARAGSDDLILKRSESDQMRLSIVRLERGRLVLLRVIESIRAGALLVKCQVWQSPTASYETAYECRDIRSNLHTLARPEYVLDRSHVQGWNPFVHLPDRLAAEKEFTGRQKELEDLCDWAGDDGSRCCLIYGDGGIGKTTLVIEFIHRWLDGKLRDLSWRPDLITFFTAKKTRWGVGGLEQIDQGDIGIKDFVRSNVKLLMCAELDRSWYAGDEAILIGRLSSLLAKQGYRKEQHLIILDNTETLTDSVEDLRNLGDGIKLLARKIGRIIVTSRRTEHIEARPVPIESWSEDESARYLKQRGVHLCIDPLVSAGEATLKRYGRELQNKPIILEALVQALKRSGSGLEAAFSEIQGLQRKDLGEFLYDDAWGRMSGAMKYLLSLMARVADLHDKLSLELCCRKVGITVLEAEDALRESRGIAAISDYQGGLEIVLTPGFMKFCIDRKVVINGESVPRSDEHTQIHSEYRRAIKDLTNGSNWQMRALRSKHARSAQRSFDTKKRDESLSHFRLAIEEDGENGALRCQYAKVLTTYRRHDEALEQANLGVQLEPNDPECWFIKARIEIERGSTFDALNTLNKAERFGKDVVECDLLRARAYIDWRDTTRYEMVDPARIERDKDGKEVPIDEKGNEKTVTFSLKQRAQEGRRYLERVKTAILPGSSLASDVRRLETRIDAMRLARA